MFRPVQQRNLVIGKVAVAMESLKDLPEPSHSHRMHLSCTNRAH
jgi:hypothetical protein